jgi:hypothetical protein
VTIPTGSYGIWPFNLDCDGVTLQYATAQPLCRVDTVAKTGASLLNLVLNTAGSKTTHLTVYFFKALDGITPDFVLGSTGKGIFGLQGAEKGGNEVRSVSGTINSSFRVLKDDGNSVLFVVLTSTQAEHLYRETLAGQDRLILSNATILTEGNNLRLQSDNPEDLLCSIFPAVSAMTSGTTTLTGQKAWLFQLYTAPGISQPAPVNVTVSQDHPAGPLATTMKGADDVTWNDAAVYKLNIPAEAANRHIILNINYIGDAARLYIGDKLYDDNFYNGDPFAIALWRIPADQWPNLSLKILPYSDALNARLPQQAKDAVAAAKAASILDSVTVTTSEQVEADMTAQ